MTNLHKWPEKQGKKPQPQPSAIEQHLYTLGLQIGQVLTKIEVLGTDGQKMQERLHREAGAIRGSLDGLASEMAGQDARIAAIERHLERQDAEAAGFRRALGWGGAILSGVSVAFGWGLSYWLGSR